AVDRPVVARPYRQGRADETVALRLREQGRELLARRLGLELEIEAELDLDEREPAVRLAPRDRARRRARSDDVDADSLGVIAEARQGAADEPRQHQVLRRPSVRRRQRGQSLGADASVPLDRDGVA